MERSEEVGRRRRELERRRAALEAQIAALRVEFQAAEEESTLLAKQDESRERVITDARSATAARRGAETNADRANARKRK
jgi:circadian clock protein KaiC